MQHIGTQVFNDPHRIEWHNDDSRPSWKRSGTGRAYMQLHAQNYLPRDAAGNINGPWSRNLNIQVTEAPAEGNARTVMITLDQASAREIYKFLAAEFASV
jgi:hypothetical protein